MHNLKFLISRVFFLNLLLAILVVFGIFKLTIWWLDSYTRHGESITVPDLSGYTLEQAERKLEAKDLHYFIMDSVDMPEEMPNTIVEQDPFPGDKVKRGRKIYVTVTRQTRLKVNLLSSLLCLEGKQACFSPLCQNFLMIKMWWLQSHRIP